ncbi:hypothetical protein GCM10022243_05670 [Saccharothrix violaceirubra]|uniref:Uncharacterized protein n=1 Tax=Saccharothrix violaceirubra TaxID=413306 RepID=A0A7W7SXW8_9PSEU|nr:hypothetical protein [Saccharothrix violaceirubra]MBB4962977.1 hypothetical protein [Saccharothrix violaceirubra]
MQRTTRGGRRHGRTGSVSVAELIRRQPTSLRAPVRRPAAVEADVEPHSRPTNRTARTAGFATGAFVLVAAVAAATFLAHRREPGPTNPATRSPVAISGAPALRPDKLWAELGGTPASLSVAPFADFRIDEAAVVVPPPEATAGSKPQVDIVRRFYELLPAKPAAAARLLSPDLVGTSPGEFVAAWEGIKAITIESTSLRPDGAVHAAVSMQGRSGDWIRVEQLFWLTDTTTPRIVGTEVISAQRS